MAKDTDKFRQQIMTLFTFHPWLKIIALILAILIWFYVRAEIARLKV